MSTWLLIALTVAAALLSVAIALAFAWYDAGAGSFLPGTAFGAFLATLSGWWGEWAGKRRARRNAERHLRAARMN